MNMFEGIADQVNAMFSDWIQVVDNKSKWTIEDFPYETGVDETVTYPHCWRCVTVNKCWFKNENNKIPTENTLTPNLGLYHPNCHCKKFHIKAPKVSDIELIVLPGKIGWLFKDKKDWLIAMGYELSEVDIILQNLCDACKQAYCLGNYTIRLHDKYGVKITLYINMIGGNGRFYNLKSSFMIFPNGKLKNNTLIGGQY